MKSILCTLALLFATTLFAQEAVTPQQPSGQPAAYSELQPVPDEFPPTPLPDAQNSYLEHPAIGDIVSSDYVTLPGTIGNLRRDELAYSVAERQDTAEAAPPSWETDRRAAF